MQQDHILYLSKSNIAEIIENVDSVRVIGDVLKSHSAKETVVPPKIYLGWINAKNEWTRSLSLAGHIGGAIQKTGVKIINSNAFNPSAREINRAHGITTLFDSVTGVPYCIAEASLISATRTAAVSAVAVQLLSSKNPRKISLLGAGEMAVHHLKLILPLVPSVEVVSIYSQREKSRISFANKCSDVYPVEFKAVNSPDKSIKDADIILACTTAEESYIPFEWLKPGSVSINVSLADFMPEVILRSDSIFVDDWHLVNEYTRRPLGEMSQAGLIEGPDSKLPIGPGNPRRVNGELGDILNGRYKGRRSEDQIIFVNPLGLAVEDVALLSIIFERAIQLGIGQKLQI